MYDLIKRAMEDPRIVIAVERDDLDEFLGIMLDMGVCWMSGRTMSQFTPDFNCQSGEQAERIGFAFRKRRFGPDNEECGVGLGWNTVDRFENVRVVLDFEPKCKTRALCSTDALKAVLKSTSQQNAP